MPGLFGGDAGPAGSGSRDSSGPGPGAAPQTAERSRDSPGEAATPEAVSTYHHEGLGVWFDYPQAWSVAPFASAEEAKDRGFEFAGCGNQTSWDQRPVQVFDERGTEVAALGRTMNVGCVAVPAVSTIEIIDAEPVALSAQGPVSFYYLTTAAADGGLYPVLGLTGEEVLNTTDQSKSPASSVAMRFAAQSENPTERFDLSFATTTSFGVDVNDGTAPHSDVALIDRLKFETHADAEKFSKSALYQQLKDMFMSTRYQESRERPSGDLGLAQTISLPACDGTQIAVVGTSWTPTEYKADIERYLKLFPGSEYSRTDFLCTSFLRPALDNSDDNYIYFVFQRTGNDTARTCQIARDAASAGGNTHGKWLRNVAWADRGEQVPC
ncbi:hypothetical protein ACXR2W_11455 [Leucobacter sp. HY1908]